MTEVLQEQPTNWMIRTGIFMAGAVLVTGCEAGNSTSSDSVTSPVQSPVVSSAPVAPGPEASVAPGSTMTPEQSFLESAIASSPAANSILQLAPNTMKFPFMCDEVVTSIDFTSAAELNEVGTSSPIDKLVPETNPQPDCAEGVAHAAAERKANQPLYQDRGGRQNNNYPRADKRHPNGYHANDFVPEVAHWPGTPEAGQPGNDVIFGHRTEAGAPFWGIDMAKVGDLVYVAGSDGETYTYKVIKVKTQLVPSSAVNEVVDFPDRPDKQGSYLTIFACGPAQREASHRLVVRFELVS